MKELADEKLMAMVQQGKLNYMELLFVKYQKQIYNYFLKCTLDREESHDLTQNTFVRVMKYRNSFKADRGFRVWLFQIARNQVKDHYRSRQNTLDQVNHEEDVTSLADESISHEQMEQEQHLHAALSKLPPDKRELLVMSKFQGLKYEEIAEIRDSSVSAIKVQVHRTIAQLRKIYFEEING